MPDDEYVPDYIGVEVEETEAGSTIRLAGEIDALVAPELRKLLIAALRKGPIVVDLAGVTFIDSSGIGALVGARMTVPPEEGQRFVVRSVPEPIQRVFKIGGVSHLLEGG